MSFKNLIKLFLVYFSYRNVQNTKDKQVKNDLENEAMLEDKIS